MKKQYLIIVLILFVLNGYSQKEESHLYNNKGQLYLDTTLCINEKQFDFFENNESEIVSVILKQILDSLPHQYASDFSMNDFRGNSIVSLLIENNQIDSITFIKRFLPIRNDVKNIEKIVANAISIAFFNIKTYSKTPLIDGTYFIPIHFNSVELKRDTTIYRSGLNKHRILIEYNLNSADYCEFSEEYSHLISNGFQKISSEFHMDSLFFSNIIPDTIPYYWEYRTFHSSNSLKKMPTYGKKYFFSKRKIIKLNNECPDKRIYKSSYIDKPEYIDTICSAKGFLSRAGRFDLTYNYVICLKNNEINVYNTKEEIIKFIGDITTIEEAYFLCKLHGYRCLYYKKDNNNHFEFIVNLVFGSNYGSNDAYKIEIINNEITNRVRICTSSYNP